MQTFIQDIRYGLRTLMKSPGFSLIAILSLALGIGANTAIFSIIDALMLRQLPVLEPERLALIGEGRMMGIIGGVPGRSMDLISEAELSAIRKDGQFFEDAAGLFSLPWTYHAFVGPAAAKEPIQAHVVTGNYFSVLGVKPAAGRLFTDAEDTPINAHAEVVISYAWWKRRFAGSSGAIGQQMRIADRSYRIIGVTAPEFFGTVVGESPDAWFPLSMQSQLPPFFDFHNEKIAHLLYGIGRLKPGASLQQVSAGLTIFMRQLLRSYSGSAPSKQDLAAIEKTSVVMTPAARGLSMLRRSFSRPLQVLMVVVALVLLISCANVANLLLAKATARQREMAIRFAVGSGRARILRQLLTESLLLSMAGAASGVLLAMWGTRVLIAMVTAGPDPAALDVNPNLRVLTFTLFVSLLTAVLFGVAPALRGSSVDLNAGLRESRGETAGQSRMLAARALVVGQVAMSLLLLIGAGLFIRNFRNLENIDTGFSREHELVFSMDTDSIGYQQDERLTTLYQTLEDRVSKMPGVRAASFSMFAFDQGSMNLDISAEGHPDILANHKTALVQVTGPQYLEATGIPILKGRYFQETDSANSPKVAAINETAARAIFGNDSPIGKRISLGPNAPGKNLEIVGVVKNAKYVQLREETPWAIYVPYAQRPQFLRNLIVNVKGDPKPIIQEIRQAIQETNRNIPITEVTTMAEVVDRSLQTQKLVAQLSAFFGGLGLLLAALGLYGILSYSVARRTNEIGIRMALGAESIGVVWMILRETLLLVGMGVAIGVPAAILCSRFVESLLYGLKAMDVFTMGTAALVLLCIGVTAGLIPARRASRVDPMVALRYE